MLSITQYEFQMAKLFDCDWFWYFLKDASDQSHCGALNEPENTGIAPFVKDTVMLCTHLFHLLFSAWQILKITSKNNKSETSEMLGRLVKAAITTMSVNWNFTKVDLELREWIVGRLGCPWLSVLFVFYDLKASWLTHLNTKDFFNSRDPSVEPKSMMHLSFATGDGWAVTF